MKLKYIAYQDNCGTAQIAVFLETVGHNTIGRGLNVLGAGFCNLDTDDLENCRCYGKSTTLGIDSRGDLDTDLLRQMLHGQNEARLQYFTFNDEMGNDQIVIFAQTGTNNSFGSALSVIGDGLCTLDTDNLDNCRCYEKSVPHTIGSRGDEDSDTLRQMIRYHIEPF